MMYSIRPSTSIENRLRRISGRFQITPDGRHLIDGVAFGRQPTRHSQASRPPIRIPPRRCEALILPAEDDAKDISTQDDSMALVVANDDDDDAARTSSQESDGSYDPTNEIVMLESDEDSSQDSNRSDEEFSEAGRIEAAQELGRLSPSGQWQPNNEVGRRLSRNDAAKTSRAALNSAEAENRSSSRLSDDHDQSGQETFDEPMIDPDADEGRVRSGSRPKRTRRNRSAEPTTRNKPILKRLRSTPRASGYSSLPSSGTSLKSVHFQHDRPPSSIRDSSDSSEDHDYRPPTDRAEASGSSPTTSVVSSVSSLSQTPSPSPNVSPSPTVSSSFPSVEQVLPSSSSLSSASLSSSSGGSTQASGVPSHRSLSEEVNGHGPSSARFKPAGRTEPIVQPHKAPGTGQPTTKKRNQRRARHKAISRKQREGLLPPNATWDDYLSWERGESNSVVHQPRQDLSVSVTDANADTSEFEAKRQALLSVIAPTRVEVGHHEETQDSSKGTTLVMNPGREKAVPSPNSAQGLEILPDATKASKTIQRDRQQQQQSEQVPLRRRTKLDVASSRRMLLGALGIPLSSANASEKKPGSKTNHIGRAQTDGRAGRKHIRFDDASVSQSNNESNAPPPSEMAGPEADPSSVSYENWKEKIVLDAVECCDDHVILSTPPFPFVQRWDPQQKLPGRKGKGLDKKRKRNQPRYYQQDEHYFEGEQDGMEPDKSHESPTSEFRPKKRAETTARRWRLDSVNPAPPEKTMTGEMQSSLEDDQEDDIPAMSKDVRSYLDLDLLAVLPGAIVGFKRLVITANWQPELSEYQTAKVIKPRDGNMVEMKLAKRDRQTKDKAFDESGQRIYGKFEGPDLEDDEGDVDGLLKLPFSELIEPKLVQAAIPNDSTDVRAPDSSVSGNQELEWLSEKSPVQEYLVDTAIYSGQIGNSATNDSNNVTEGAKDIDGRMTVDPRSTKNVLCGDSATSEGGRGPSAAQVEAQPVHLEPSVSPRFSGFDLNEISPPKKTQMEGLSTPNLPDINHTERSGYVDDTACKKQLEVAVVDNASTPADTVARFSGAKTISESLVAGATAMEGARDNFSKTRSIWGGHHLTEDSGNGTSDGAARAAPVAKVSPSVPQLAPSYQQSQALAGDDGSSECELPHLDKIFSTFRASQSSIKDEIPLSSSTKPANVSGIAKADPSSTATENNTGQEMAVGGGGGGNRTSTLSRASDGPKAVKNTVYETVDLTQLSDGINQPTDAYDSFVLPAGSGWAEKVTASVRRGGRGGRKRRNGKNGQARGSAHPLIDT